MVEELIEEPQSLGAGLKALFMSRYTADVVARHGVMDEAGYLHLPTNAA
jgi:hypothetical protein